MKRVLLSLAVIFAVSVAAFGLSSAFFSDTETSQDNTFTAGKLDLEIDNQSYYNGVLNQNTTWPFEEWANQLFFNFDDVKPDDYGEDTISLHAENDYWLCMDMQVTKDDDNTCTEPEKLDDPNCDIPTPEPNANLFDGELGGLLNFVWWPDDGDNVLEDDESPFLGVATASAVLNSSVTLADSLNNIFDTNGPLLASNTYYIGKAWCFGNMGLAPLPQASYNSPAGDNDLQNGAGTPEDGGFTCDGTALNNATQSDILMGDITFNAYQARNNPEFLCSGEPFVDAVTSVSVSGTFGHCCDSGNLSSDPSVAAAAITGAPDSPPDADFIQISSGTTVTARFVNNKAVDGPGNDIRIHIYDALFPATANIDLGQGADCNTATYTDFGNHLDTADVDLDLNGSGLTEVQCVRLTDLGGPDLTFPTLGFDLDAIEALNSVFVP